MKDVYRKDSARNKRCRNKTSYSRMVILACMMMFTHVMHAQNYLPHHYWTFENTSTPMNDSMNNGALNPTYYQCAYTVAPQSSGSIGKSLNLNQSGGKVIVASNTITLDSVVMFEFLFKAAPEFNTTAFFTRRDGAIYIKMGYPFIQFNTTVLVNNVPTSDAFSVSLEGVGRAAYGYYSDNKWHHMVFKYNGKTGSKEIWVDGELPSGFSKTAAIGGFNKNTASPNSNIIDLNSNTSYNRFAGNIDEIAIYKIDVPSTVIYKHYTESRTGKHYTFNASSVPVPSPSPVTANADLNEFAPGHPSYTVPAIDQLKTFPSPRYKEGNTLSRNFNWIGLDYFSGYMQPGVSTAQAVSTSVQIQTELAKNFNYFVLVSGNTSSYSSYTDPTKFQGAWVQLANQNPQWGAAAISFWNQLNPNAAGYSSNTGYIENKTLPSNYYLRNSSGQFISSTGGTTVNKVWTPSAPLDSFRLDGLTQKFYLQKLTAALTRPLDIISENGEVIPKHNTTGLQADPSVVADKNTTGFDWETYQGDRKRRLALQYRDQFISLAALANTYYSEYQISGHPTRHKYSETRLIQKQKNGQYYATPDFYPRWPSNWLTGTGPWNGWKHVIDGRSDEIALGDKLYSPYVAAGWNADEERNIAPAQWLGLLKALGMLGAEYYYTGYFNEASSYNPPNPAPNNPAGYAWQAVVPSYAQAVTSRYEDILRNGSVLPGDVPNNYSNPTAPGYSFEAGDQRKLVVIRKHNTLEKYAITGSIQPNSNMMGNAELSGDASIKLNGSPLQFNIRRQGSTYIYDNTNPSSPVFYQVDEWHEASHPYRWSKDFTIEAELFDNNPASTQIKTYVPAGTAAGDFRNYTTAVTPTGTSNFASLEYNFLPRNQSTYHVWVRARSKNSSAAGFTVGLQGQTAKTISCITDTAWNWYSLDACSAAKISFTGLSNQNYKLVITPTTAALEIDKILLTIDPAINLNPNQASCGATAANVTLNGPASFCQGGNVTLTAATGTAYQWSSGQTTQSIVASATGNYVVTVSNGTGCNAISSPVAVTVLSRPAATVTAGGNTTICTGQSVALTASAASSYLWSNGATTQTINATAAGNYSVTITGANGCTASSPAQSVTVSNIATPSVTLNGSASICSGNTVTLTAPSGYSYTWSSGQTTQSVVASTAGNYIVTVSNGTGCNAVSAPVVVTVLSRPAATITAGGSTTICTGQSVALTASAGASYLWSNGATTQTINATTAGNYSVTVTGSNGCTASSTAQAVTVSNIATPTVTLNGPASICSGSTVTLSAPAGFSYSWSSGQTTQSIVASAAGNYVVTVSNGTGCNGVSAPVAVTVLSRPVAAVTAAGNTNICAGQSVALSASSASSYLWNNGATTQTIQASNAGSYAVTVTGANGCTATSLSQAITVSNIATPVITLSGPATICNGSGVNLTAPSGYSYVWSNGNTTQTISAGTTGNYAVTVTSQNGCTATSQPVAVSVNQPQPAVVNASGPLSFCDGGSVTLQAASGQSFLWSDGSTASSVTAYNSGSYAVTITDANGCSSVSSPVTVNEFPAANVNISVNGNLTLAQGETVQLTATGAVSYNWQPGGLTTPAITVASAGDYTVTGTDANGCTATSQIVSVSQSAAVNVSIQSAGPLTVCQGNSVTINATGAQNYLWVPGGATTPSLTVTTGGKYYVYATDVNGAILDMDSINVTVMPSPMKPFITTTYIPNTAYQLQAYEPSAVSYQWTNGQSLSSVTLSSAQTIGVRVVNAFGCISDLNEITVGSPASASCTSPDMLTYTNPSDTGVSVQWNPALTADDFTVSYWPESDPAAAVSKVVSGNTTMCSLNNLQAGTDYKWHVSSRCGATVNTSGDKSFRTLGTPLNCGSQPMHTQAICLSPRKAQLLWFATTADNFTVRYRVAGKPTYKYIQLAGNTAMSGTILSNLLPNTSYEWSVMTNCGGYPSSYTQPSFFTTPDLCGYLGTITVQTVTLSSATIKWEITTPMDSVKIRVTNMVTGTKKTITLPYNPSTGLYTITGLKKNTPYTVDARGRCNSGLWGSWSDAVTFTTGAIIMREDPDNPLQLIGYPNPATDLLNFTFNSNDEHDYTYKVCDMSGRQLMQQTRNASTGDNSESISVNGYAKGIYLLIITKGTMTSHFRFSVQ